MVENIHFSPTFILDFLKDWKHWNLSAPDLGPWLLTWQVNLGPVLVIFFFSAALCSNFMPDFGHLWLFCTFVILSRISVVILYLALIVWGHLSKFVVISSVFLVISCVSVQVLWVLFLTFVLTLPITDCFTSQFGCFTHYFDYFWTLYAPDCGHFVVTIFSLFLKVFLWSSFTLWSFYKYLWLLWTSIQFFCFYFGYFEVTMHQILLIMVIMLFCPTLRQLGASFCGCSLHFNFFARGSHYVSVVIWHSSVGFFWVYASLLWSYNGFMCQFYALFVDNLCTSLVILCLCCLILTIFEALSLFKAILWSFSLIVITLW